MLLGRSAKPENIAYTLVPWPKFNEPDPETGEERSSVLVELRRVPPSLAMSTRAKHLGDVNRIEYEDRGKRGPREKAQTVRKSSFSNSAQHAFMIDICAWAMGDIVFAPFARDRGRPEWVLDDDETASKVWQLLTKQQQQLVGELRAGSKLPLDDGMLRTNKALREWLLAEDNTLLTFVNEETDRLADAVIKDEEGKG